MCYKASSKVGPAANVAKGLKPIKNPAPERRGIHKEEKLNQYKDVAKRYGGLVLFLILGLAGCGQDSPTTPKLPPAYDTLRAVATDPVSGSTLQYGAQIKVGIRYANSHDEALKIDATLTYQGVIVSGSSSSIVVAQPLTAEQGFIYVTLNLSGASSAATDGILLKMYRDGQPFNPVFAIVADRKFTWIAASTTTLR